MANFWFQFSCMRCKASLVSVWTPLKRQVLLKVVYHFKEVSHTPSCFAATQSGNEKYRSRFEIVRTTGLGCSICPLICLALGTIFKLCAGCTPLHILLVQSNWVNFSADFNFQVIFNFQQINKLSSDLLSFCSNFCWVTVSRATKVHQTVFKLLFKLRNVVRWHFGGAKFDFFTRKSYAMYVLSPWDVL